MRVLCVGICVFLISWVAFAQGDRGTLTGTVSDPGGAVVASATIEARHIETGATYQTQTTGTGNYTLAQLPAGSYEISVSVPGFKKYVRKGLTVQVASDLRIDVGLEVGSASESVTVTEAAALLATENGEVSHNVTAQRLDELPVLGVGVAAGSGSIRNPIAVVSLIPGVYNDINVNLRVNGAPSNTQAIRVEGQDSTNGYVSSRAQMTQPGVDAIQEVAVQTSNFAAEYGQVGGGFFNYTMKSGTNQLHGTVYDYFVNEFLNAGTPFTNDGNGHLLRPAQRRQDWGFTVGGPVVLPKLYNGRDKTFFFFNFESYREFSTINNQSITVPIQAYRDGNFARALTGRTLGTDSLGRPILENQIYDPSTQRTVNGQIVRDPYPGNIVPVAQMDPVALKVQALIPLPNSAPNALTNNGIYPYLSDRISYLPSFKIDQNLGSKSKASFYFSRIYTNSKDNNTTDGGDGLPELISAHLGTRNDSHMYRLNIEHSITPSLLLHLGAGYQDNYFNDDVQNINYDSQAQLGLVGRTVPRNFPQFTNANNAQGGVKNMGPSVNRNIYYQKPTANVSLTSIRGNHTYKAGSEMRLEGYPTTLYTAANGLYSFSSAETGLPYLNATTVNGGNIGFPYASFLLGLVDTGTIANPPSLRLGRQQWGFFAQDSWKVNRKLTLDYGLRYDYQTYLKETYGRVPDFSASVPNPSAGGRLGAVAFEGDGPGRCNCTLAKNYPWAFGPRIGGAYQINSKTVIRAGWGIVYGGTPDNNGATSSVATPSPFSSPAFGQPAMVLRNGIPITPAPWPNFNPGQYPLPGTLTGPKVALDQNAGRPPRQNQWSIGIQREISRNLLVEASFVGNRGVWWTAPALIDINALTPQILSSVGLDINNAADRTLLTSPLNSPTATSRGFNKPPYSGFPLTTTVAQSLRPFPQFGALQSLWSPVGKTWYNSLQSKVTKRLSHGLTATGAFSWQKTLTMASETDPANLGLGSAVVNDVFNRQQNKYLSIFDQPLVFNFAVSYTVPNFKLRGGVAGQVASWIARDWSLAPYAQYGSGLPIAAPLAQNNLNQLLLRNTATLSFANRVPGVPVFTQDLNCHCFDPNKVFVLNPAAWTQPAAGQWGTSAAYYSDYRYQRIPAENFGIGRTMRFKERFSLSVRADFINIFNRTRLNSPIATNALATQTRNTAGQPTAGFGWISTAFGAAGPSNVAQFQRTGTLVARITF